MDKADAKIPENQSDTSSVITMKEYASSEYPGSEPPPAYMKPRSVALRIAKLVAFTVIASSVILGGFILAASWIQANAARNLDLTLNQELLDDLQPGYEHLIAEEVLPERTNDNSIRNIPQEKTEPAKEKEEKNEEGLVPPPPPPSPSEKKSLELDEIANALIQKNVKGNVNCIIERRRNEELVDHAPRALNLPFGLNITTPPRLQHVTGEQMVVVCKNDDEEQEKEEEQKEENVQSVFPFNGINPMPQIVRLPQMTQIPMQRFPPARPQQTIYHTPIVYEPREIPIPPPQPQQQQQHNPFDRRVPLEPMAVNDVPLSRMPMTHMPFRNEEESGPLRRLVPPHPQRYSYENFGREEPRYEPQIFRSGSQFPRQRFLFPNREEDEDRPAPVEGRFLRPSPLPFPSRKPEGAGNPLFGELRREPKIIRMIPLRMENAAPVFPGKRIRFPETEEQTERRGPLVAEITKIVPVGIEKDGSDSNGLDDSEEFQGFGGRPFPIPIDAILEAVLKGVGAAVEDGESGSVPVDVKIERIEAEPVGKPIFLEKLEKEEKKPVPSEDSESSRKPEPSTLMIDDVEKEKVMPSSEVEGKSDKSETVSKSEKNDEAASASPSDGTFLPDGSGRGAGAFPIPRGISEAEIFTVSDAAAAGENQNVEIPVRFSVAVAEPGTLPSPEGRRGKVMNFERPVEGEINIFPQAEGRAMKPQPVRTSDEIRSRVFNIDDARSVRLYPVPPEKSSEQGGARPHYVQPRSV